MFTKSKFRPVPLFRDEFESIDDLPNESTLETNITHKQLVDFESLGWDSVALSPTRFAEGNIGSGGGPLGKGYDIRFDKSRAIVFQHKSPEKTVVRGEDNRNKRLWLQYDIDLAQLLNLSVQYEPRQAYLVLPLVPQQNWLHKSLKMTLFIDVWTLYSGIKEHGLCPDYILVEFLPDWMGGMRPAYDRTGHLKPMEYFRNEPIVKCKHKCDKWGMKATDPDPYIELTVGESVFAQTVRWGQLRKAFQKDSLGLGITNALRTDGGQDLPEDWPHLEIPDGFSEEYRAHIKRTYALSRLGDQYDEPNGDSLVQWLLDDLNNRYERAIELELIDSPLPQAAVSDLVEDVSNYKISTKAILERFMGKSNPETYRLGSGTRRLILQTGTNRKPPLRIS